MMTMLIRGGRLVDPASSVDAHLDVMIVDGRVAQIGAQLLPADGMDVVEGI